MFVSEPPSEVNSMSDAAAFTSAPMSMPVSVHAPSYVPGSPAPRPRRGSTLSSLAPLSLFNSAPSQSLSLNIGSDKPSSASASASTSAAASNQPSFTPASTTISATTPEFVVEPTLIPFPADVIVSQIVAGETVSLACDTKGRVYSWGQQSSGLLGSSALADRPFPEIVQELSSYFVVLISLGTSHALALLNTGRVISWGVNKNGQLGRNTESASLTSPIAESRVSSLPSSLSNPSSFCGTPLFGAMSNTPIAGNTSNGTFEPGFVSLPDDAIITAVSCGKAHCFAVTEEGELYAWGKTTNGVLGISSSDERSSLQYPSLVEYFEPIPEDELLFSSAVGSWSHSVALSTDGRVYTCGAISQGKLGY